MKLFLGLQILATLFMVGVIWFVQIVHYPLFKDVGSEHFKAYEKRHQRLTTWVVGPAMLTELATAVMLLKYVPSGDRPLAWAGVVLVVGIWLATTLLSVPAHSSLAEGFTQAAHRKLVLTNWLRTAAWTARGVLALVLAHRCLRIETM